MTKTQIIQVIGETILVKPDEVSEKSAGGSILVPTSARQKPTTGVVTGVGMGAPTPTGIRVLPEVSVGDRIIFRERQYSHDKITVGEEEYLVLTEDDIIAKIA